MSMNTADGHRQSGHLRVCARLSCGLVLLVLVTAAGCGQSSGLVPVTGTVMLDGSPLDRARVVFHPQPGVKGNGGDGVTDQTGRFLLRSPQGRKGIFPGDYTVSVTSLELSEKAEKRVAEMRAQGLAPTVVAADTKETLPLVYTKPETTPLRQSVGAKGARDVIVQLETPSKAAGR